MKSLHAFLAASLSTIGVAQTTWVVDALNGPGTDFVTIGAAVAAATDGDTVFVRSGTYPPFLLDKGLRVVGQGSVDASGGFTVAGVPAGATARVVGVTPQLAHPPLAVGFRVLDCEGHVHLTDIGSPNIGGDAAILRSAFVTIHRCGLVGSVSSALAIEDSTVQISSSSMSIPSASFMGAGMTCSNSSVTIGSTTVLGFDAPLFGMPGAGIVMEGGSLTLASDVRVFAGMGTGSVSAIAATGGVVVHDPDAVFVATGPVITGSATVSVRRVASAEVQAATVGGTLATRFLAPAGTAMALLFGAPAAPVTIPFGELMVGGVLTVLDSGVMPAAGERGTVLPVPIGTPPGLAFTVQGVLLEAGQLSLSAASTAVLGV